MEHIKKALEQVDWHSMAATLTAKGYALLPRLLNEEDCRELIAAYDRPEYYRKTIAMARYRFGEGTYKYFRYPLPDRIQYIRQAVYSGLAPVANAWMEALQTNIRYPGRLEPFLEHCREQGQDQPTVLILKYGTGGHNTLHQDIYGNIYFPLQAVLFLNAAGSDYRGGEFVLTEQVPRAQSRATVLQPGRGDMLLFTTNFRPVKGSRGYYRAHIRHGVSELHHGTRHTIGIIFHDAAG